MWSFLSRKNTSDFCKLRGQNMYTHIHTHTFCEPFLTTVTWHVLSNALYSLFCCSLRLRTHTRIEWPDVFHFGIGSASVQHTHFYAQSWQFSLHKLVQSFIGTHFLKVIHRSALLFDFIDFRVSTRSQKNWLILFLNGFVRSDFHHATLIELTIHSPWRVFIIWTIKSFNRADQFAKHPFRLIDWLVNYPYWLMNFTSCAYSL